MFFTGRGLRVSRGLFNFSANNPGSGGVGNKLKMRDSIFISCPFHEGDRTPSLSILLKNKGTMKAGFCHCFGCGWSGNFLQVERALGRRLDIPPEIRATMEMGGSKYSNTKLKVRPAVEENKRVKKGDVPFKFSKYLQERGIGEVIQCFNRVYEKGGSIMLPFFNPYGVMEGYIERKTNRKWYQVEGSIKYPIGIEEVFELDFIYAVEGQIDKMSMEEMGFKAVAIGTVSNYKLISKLKNYNICLAYDNDEAGNKACSLTREFIKNKALYRVTFPEGIKDANELLLSYGKREGRSWVKAHTEYIE